MTWELVTGWDTSECFEDYIDDPELESQHYHQMINDLTLAMNKVQGYRATDYHWTAYGENMGWRRIKGEKSFFADSGEELLTCVLPRTDCTFKVYHDGQSSELKITNSHHDAQNEVYIIRPTLQTMED